MKPRKLLPHIVAVTLVTLLLVACGGSSPQAEIQTSQGTVILQDVELADRFPPDCDAGSSGCVAAQDGHRYLVLWLRWADVEGPGIPVEKLGMLTDFAGESGSAYVVDGDGARTEAGGSGLESGRLFVTFSVPDGARDFTLHWPDNPAVDLGK